MTPRNVTRRTAVRLTVLALILAALSIAGCGFQLRGQGQNHLPSPLYITGLSTFDPLYRELTRQLDVASVTRSDSVDGAAAVLRIIKRDSDARVLSVDSRNKAVEFELEESARFSLTRAQGETADEQTVRVLRIQFRPSDAVLGSERESVLTRRDMLRELAQKVLSRAGAQF
ncbi:MAG: hypothetical protein KDJ27_11705 [Gammaproteobacteria bacterium]|nr:hypothetical protein [Gammaproteobacteria bacterium]